MKLVLSLIEMNASEECAFGTSRQKVAEALATVLEEDIEKEFAAEAAKKGHSVITVQLKTPAVQEIFTTVERIKKAAEGEGLSTIPWVSLEFGHDSRDPKARNRVLHEIAENKPYVLTLAFPCTVWSSLQNINADRSKLEDRREAERQQLNFVLAACFIQLKAGRHTLLENQNAAQRGKKQHSDGLQSGRRCRRV